MWAQAVELRSRPESDFRLELHPILPVNQGVVGFVSSNSNRVSGSQRRMPRRVPRPSHSGAVAIDVGIKFGAISGMTRLALHAARSIG